MRVVLVPGGLWEPAMTADRFWEQTGIASGLRVLGYDVVLFDRTYDAPSWDHDAPALLAELTEPAAIIAGSNGCSLAVRAALAAPSRVRRLILGWPATARNLDVDASYRAGLTQQAVPAATVDALLDGETLRGTTDAELSRIINVCRVIPSEPANRAHQPWTWRRLVELGAELLPGCPEPPMPTFPAHLDGLLRTLDRVLT